MQMAVAGAYKCCVVAVPGLLPIIDPSTTATALKLMQQLV
jgi:hypothetical protein